MKNVFLLLTTALMMTWLPSSQASVSLDRTRVVFDSGKKAFSVNIKNDSSVRPYLAQAWVSREDEEDKAAMPLTVVPPLQRLEPDARSVVTIKALPTAKKLPEDRESLFFFNLRGIPPKGEAANTLQIALQSRVKLFYRPAALVKSVQTMTTPWQEQVTLTRKGNTMEATNPTPFYVVIISAKPAEGQPMIAAFSAVTLAPKSTQAMPGQADRYGKSPVLTYLNDYGGKVSLPFTCNGASCTAVPSGNKA